MGSSTSLHTKRYMAFLRRLREARREAGLTQVQVAKALRKPQTWVSKYELGERRVDAVEFGDFCRLYGKPPRYFRTSYQGCRADYPAAPPWCFARNRCRASSGGTGLPAGPGMRQNVHPFVCG